MASQLNSSEIASLVSKQVARVAEMRDFACNAQRRAYDAALMAEEATDGYHHELRMLAGYRAVMAEREMSVTSVHGHTYPSALRSFQFFHDSSWGNDSTDSVAFAIGNTPITVWVDHMLPECRTSDMLSARFVVCQLCDGDPSRQFSEKPPTLHEMVNERNISDAPPLLETDSPDELLTFLRDLAQRELASCLSAEER